MQRTQRAFTLIELLIVVAIISILAAIAVPNFLHAQLRARIARAQADMRTLATAVETYCVDCLAYPRVGDEFGDPIAPYPSGGPEILETRLSIHLTTPVRYLAQRLPEPFPAEGDGESAQYHYSTRDYAEAKRGAAGVAEFLDFCGQLGQRSPEIRYLFLSHGPDRDHDDATPALYDATNGLVSSGDIVYFGPGGGLGR
ncbi:prepilin-type N-terminal cleavage/methylation domain-containing protein [bacterium]|nr:prepilin-type N-terminal cleavage/methylation domain-containing protein [bacterium]